MLEFTTWFVWLALFALLQRRLCRSFPGIRSACRNAYLWTAAVVVLPGMWLVAQAPAGSPHLLAQVNHCFALGVCLQTFLRALIHLMWLGTTSLHSAPATFTLHQERQLLALVASMPQLLKSSQSRKHLS